MTLPVPNLGAPIASLRDAKGNEVGKAFVIPPWNSWFQGFSQKAPSVQDVTSGGSPFTANQNGTVILKGASTVHFTRGNILIDLSGIDPTIIPISISDVVSWTGPATVQFLGA